MTEASGGVRAEMERRLIERSLQDEDFRRRLLEDPKATVEQELGRAVARRGAYRGRRGDRRHHLPRASQQVACRARGPF
jgi:hypothetical protein